MAKGAREEEEVNLLKLLSVACTDQSSQHICHKLINLPSLTTPTIM
jgi:hypothetical protein